MKKQKWMEVKDIAISCGYTSEEKDYSYIRDTVWQNFKKTTMKKIDNARLTGSTGLEKLTEVDNLVLMILGKDSPLLPREKYCYGGQYEIDQVFVKKELFIESPSEKEHQIIAPPATVRKKKYAVRKKPIPTLEALKKKKIEAEIESIHLNNYKTKLEIYALEKRLGLEHSSFTSQLTESIIYPYKEEDSSTIFSTDEQKLMNL
ncbi:hypothetical protein JTB14_033810 [Gonioctena quinquepunctata]|nr:hypothetical protein JTB14_033810 [Gonioctena quinquepunctata]